MIFGTWFASDFRLLQGFARGYELDKWRFYQGLRNEWRWYHFNDAGQVIAASDQGFDNHSYAVHTRDAGSIAAQ